MKKIAKNFSWVAFAALIEKAVVFFLYIYLGRLIEPEAYGYLNYILAVASYFVIFIEMGLPRLGIREVASNTQLAWPLYRIVTQIKFLLFLSVSVVWIVYIVYSDETYRSVGLVLTFYLFARVIDVQWVIEAEQHFKTVAKLKYIKIAVLLVSLLVLKLTSNLFIYTLFFVAAAMLPTIWYLARQKAFLRGLLAKQRYKKIHIGRMRVLFRKSLPLTASSFLILMYYNLDTVLIRYFMDLEAVAQYTAAYKLVFAFIIARNLLNSVVFPRISRAKMNWHEDKYLWVLSLAAATAVGLIGYFFASDILYLAYGEKYLSSAKVFWILSLTASMLWLNLFFPSFFIAIKKEYFYLKVQLFATMINLVANVVLIPRYGIEGAAWATLMADIVSLVVFGGSYYVMRYGRSRYAD